MDNFQFVCTFAISELTTSSQKSEIKTVTCTKNGRKNVSQDRALSFRDGMVIVDNCIEMGNLFYDVHLTVSRFVILLKQYGQHDRIFEFPSKD